MRIYLLAMTLAPVLALAGCATAPGAAPKTVSAPPPVASLTDGVWLKGDLHLHSRHSKESSNNPESKIIALAEKVGMGFLAITDHDNHVNGDVAHHTWSDPELKSDSVLLFYGAEWTTHRGHGNTFSAKPYDHQSFYDIRDARDVNIGALKKKLGIHLSANHPSGKDAFSYSYDMIDSLEVWNSAVFSRNANAIFIWDDLLKSGRKMAGRGGSDAHHGYPDTPEQKTDLSWQAPLNNVGTPTTWVFAPEKTSQSVIDAITAGRVSISANPYAPRVEFYADLDQDGRSDMMMGDNVKSTGKPVTFRVQLTGASIVADGAYTINVVKDGGDFRKLETRGATPVVEFTDTPAIEGRTYYRVIVEGPSTPYPEVPEATGRSAPTIGLSNPIFFNFDPNF